MSLNPLFVRPLTYVLETEPVQGTTYPGIYVGSTMNMNQRWAQHCCGFGSKFCRVHKPVRIRAVHCCDASDARAVMRYENELTLTLMREYIQKYGPNGWQSVRGGDHCCLHMAKPAVLSMAPPPEPER